MKRLRTLKSFQIFRKEIKISKTYCGWCPFQGLSSGTTLMQIQSGRTVPVPLTFSSFPGREGQLWGGPPLVHGPWLQPGLRSPGRGLHPQNGRLGRQPIRHRLWYRRNKRAYHWGGFDNRKFKAGTWRGNCEAWPLGGSLSCWSAVLLRHEGCECGGCEQPGIECCGGPAHLCAGCALHRSLCPVILWRAGTGSSDIIVHPFTNS